MGKLDNYPELLEFKNAYMHYLEQQTITAENWALLRTEAEAFAFAQFPNLKECYKAYKSWYSSSKSKYGSKCIMTDEARLGAKVQGAKAAACQKFKPVGLNGKVVFAKRHAGCVMDNLSDIPESDNVRKLYISWVSSHDYAPKDELMAHFTGKSVNYFTKLRSDLHKTGIGFVPNEYVWKLKHLEDMTKDELIAIIKSQSKPAALLHVSTNIVTPAIKTDEVVNWLKDFGKSIIGMNLREAKAYITSHTSFSQYAVAQALERLREEHYIITSANGVGGKYILQVGEDCQEVN